jgi:hypothetical protein
MFFYIGISLANPNEFCTVNPKITKDILVFQREEKVKEIFFFKKSHYKLKVTRIP